MRRLYLMTTAALLWSGCAHAQDSAVAAAGDAFGERVGVEQVGLYDEGQARGFSLEGTGAYRIEDAYFVRAIFLPDPVLAGVSVRVGVTAARLDYPSPSGVVNYRLRDPQSTQLVISGGVRPYMTGFLDVGGTWESQDGRIGVSADFLARPDVTWEAGTNGAAYDMGVVARFQPTDDLRVRGFVSYVTRDYDGDFGVIPTDGALPPPLPKLTPLNPPWTRVKTEMANVGALVDGRAAGFNFSASAFRSMFLPERGDFTLLATDATGLAQATAFLKPDNSFVSDSTEFRLSRAFDAGALSHLVSASVRGRWSRAEYGGGQSYALGLVDTQDPLILTGPFAPIDTGDRVEDEVEQFTGSLGYGLTIGGRFEARFGAHLSRYDKRVTPIGGPESARVEDFRLFNASAIWTATDRLTVFASWVTGLEETGTAPQSAVNRNEVLPPVEAEQFELGVRYALTDRLSLIGAVFDISKPTMGMDSTGVFGPVGDVRHRGVEASLAGEVMDGMTVVLGGVVIDPEISGELVDLGVVGSEPAGLSKVVGSFNVDYRLPFAPQWTVDASVEYWGERQVDSANSFTAPAVTLVGLGARYRFQVGDTPAALRVAVSNVTGEEGWWASSSGLIWPIGPRTVRASLTFTFD